MRAWIAAGLLLVAVAVASQPTPATTQRAGMYATQGLPEGKQQHLAPIPSACKSVRCAEPAPEDAEQKHERKEHIANERTLADYTVAIAWLTGALALVAVIQACLFFWQLKLMREATNDAKKVASTAVASADLARDTFVADHRPWVKIDAIRQRGGNCLNGANDKDGGYDLDVFVKNVGNSPAVCIWVNARMVRGDQFPSEDALREMVEQMRRDTFSKGVTLLPGDSDKLSAYCVPDETKTQWITTTWDSWFAASTTHSPSTLCKAVAS